MFDSYLTEILAIQSSLDETSGTREPEEVSLGPIQPHKPVNAKHRTCHSRKDGESDSEDNEESSSKRPWLDKSNMPWFSSSDEPTIASQNPSCKETCRLLRAYNRDISKAKFFVKIAPNSPSGFPLFTVGMNPQRWISWPQSSLHVSPSCCPWWGENGSPGRLRNLFRSHWSEEMSIDCHRVVRCGEKSFKSNHLCLPA